MFHKEEALVSTDLSVMPTKSNYAYRKKDCCLFTWNILFNA